MVIKNAAGEPKSEIVVLKEYFGLQPQQTLVQFMAETKALTPEGKEELVRGAANELGYTVE